MIALQSRGAKMLDPTAQTAKYVNMMNMAKQQEAAQRQAALAQQSMDINQAEEGRRAELHGPALKKAQLEYVGLVADKFREDVAKVRDGDTAGAEAARAEAVASVPGWGNMIPPVSQWTPEVKAQLMLKAKEIVDKIYPDATASLEVSTDGIPMSTVIGGFPSAAQQRPVYDAQDTATQTTSAPPATPTAAPEMSPSPVPVGEFGETRVAPDGGTLNDFQQDHVRRMKEGLGMTDTPASFTRGSMGAGQMTPEVMSRIADSAFQTGVIAQVDFDQLLATQPPENRQAFTDAFRRANVTVQADAPSLADSGMGQQQYDGQTPQSIYAKLPAQQMPISNADLGSQPMTRQTLAQTQPRTITRLQQRTPNVSPAPAETPEQAGRRALLGRSSPAEEGAKTQATENVRLQMAPQIAAATKKAENAIALKSEAPKEKNIATRLIANIDDRIETIDRLLRNPERRSIVGRFEGNTPYILQNETQSDAQADFDSIKNTDTLTSLVELKQDSPGGGSPVGNASNSDVVLVARGANALIQTGTLPKFDAELMNIRRQLYRTRTNAINFYNDRYGDVVAADPRLKLAVPPIADRYTGPKRAGTSTKVDRNNPLLRGM
jgi:hypothetical protein